MRNKRVYYAIYVDNIISNHVICSWACTSTYYTISKVKCVLVNVELIGDLKAPEKRSGTNSGWRGEGRWKTVYTSGKILAMPLNATYWKWIRPMHSGTKNCNIVWAGFRKYFIHFFSQQFSNILLGRCSVQFLKSCFFL